MFEIFKTFFSSAKLYVCAIALSIVTTAWLFDRHAQYNAGVAYATEQEHKAQAEYNEGQIKKQEAIKEQAVKEATDAANHINSLNVEKTKLLEKQYAKLKANPTPVSCDLSDDERLFINTTISDLQGKH